MAWLVTFEWRTHERGTPNSAISLDVERPRKVTGIMPDPIAWLREEDANWKAIEAGKVGRGHSDIVVHFAVQCDDT